MSATPHRLGIAPGMPREIFANFRLRLASSASAIGGAVATLIVTLDDPTTPPQDLMLIFLVFLLVGPLLDRCSRWSTMLPFTRILIALLCPAVAAVTMWTLLAATTLPRVSLSALALAAAGAAIAGIVVHLLASGSPTRVAVIGSSAVAERLHREMIESGVSDQEIVGVLAAPAPISGAIALDLASRRPHNGSVPVLGDLADLAEIVERHRVDVLLVDGDASRADVFDRLADTCLDTPVRVCDVTQFYEDSLGHVPVANIDSVWFRYIMHPRFRSPDTPSKRAIDIGVALVTGIMFLPAIAVCALLIKLHDGGPVLFRQRRMGSRGREFTMLKLRTMRQGPVEARWSSRDDDRVTPIGRLLRRTHLDEMPQLINVLRGEMSVVGPRPEQTEFVEHLERTIPHYNRRHLIKPGLTGWAQVRCGYAGSDEGSAWKLSHDLFYLKHHSFGLDLIILAETARTLVADRQFGRPRPQEVAEVAEVVEVPVREPDVRVPQPASAH